MRENEVKIQSVAKSISLYFLYRLLCPILDAEDSWSSWGTCVQSDGNLCRCQTRCCQDKGNTPCLTDVEVRLENCTGNYENLISSLTVIFTSTVFLCSPLIRRQPILITWSPSVNQRTPASISQSSCKSVSGIWLCHPFSVILPVTRFWHQTSWWGSYHRKRTKLTFRALVLRHSLWRRANARNVNWFHLLLSKIRVERVRLGVHFL